MTSKILRGSVEIPNIKSVTYTETVNAGEGLRPGCVASSSISVECYGAQSDAPAQDEALTYYQVKNDVETLVGTYYAEPSIPSKGTYKFVAYDSVAKLDVDFSARLNEIQNDFPMTVYDLVSEACSVAGVTLGSSSWPLSTQTVQAFYADNLTCRNILQYAAEIACRFVRCNTSGEVIFDWYTTNSTGIYPGGNDNTKVAYKQNGLTYDNSNVYVVDSVAIKPSGVEGAAYIYPTSYSAVTASDPNSDGNIILTNLIASDLGNGELLLSVEAEDDNTDGNVEVGTQTVTVNPMIFSDNLLLTNASDATYLAVAQNIYDTMSALPSYRHSTTQLFVDENPFRAGEFVSVTDAQGVSFTTPVFTMTVSASGANLVSSGKVKYQEQSSTSLAKSVANLASNIVQFNTKVVFKNNLTDGETVISGDNIKTGTINANHIDLFGKMNVYDPERNPDGSIYYDPETGEQVKTDDIGGYIGTEVGENSLYVSVVGAATYEAGYINPSTGQDAVGADWYRNVGYLAVPADHEETDFHFSGYVKGYQILEYKYENGTYTYQNKYTSGIFRGLKEVEQTFQLESDTTHVRLCADVTGGGDDVADLELYFYSQETTLGMALKDSSDENYILITNNDTTEYGAPINGGIHATSVGRYYAEGELQTRQADVNMDATTLTVDADAVFMRKVYGLSKLLWRNTSLASLSATDLTSDDLEDDLANYNTFVITCYQTYGAPNNANNRRVTMMCNMKDVPMYDSAKFNVCDVTTGTAYAIIVRQREFEFNRQNNTISISTGYYSNNGTSGSDYANTMVPISIYGLNI